MKLKKKHPLTSLGVLTEEILAQEVVLREGGGESGRERQVRLSRMAVRDRLAVLLDDPTAFFELGLWAAYGMYEEWGGLPAAGVVTGIGDVAGRSCMIIANDATVKAGAMFPQSVKKVLRAQRIAFECRLPVLYLVDSSGVFLPLQDEIFPDEDDFGRIFRNNAIFSATGIPQFAAIMGNCIAGGGYLPVLCDKLLMTEGSGLYLAGPALVKAAIGQVTGTEELGGAKMHASISGTVDFCEPDDLHCLMRLRSLVELIPAEEPFHPETAPPEKKPETLFEIVSGEGTKAYDVRDLLACIVDAGSLLESKALYGPTLVTAYAKIGGMAVGIVASQRHHSQTARGEVEIGGVLYAESADKAARFVMDCNQMKIPLVFFQDVTGFMVGKEAEQAGIIRSGAKLVNALSNSIVPKLTVIVGNSFGAGHYALCGKAYDPFCLFAWPGAKYAVMGADQAESTLRTILKKKGEDPAKEALLDRVNAGYKTQTDIRYGAARGWVDALIAPDKTREVLMRFLKLARRIPFQAKSFHTGVIQV